MNLFRPAAGTTRGMGSDWSPPSDSAMAGTAPRKDTDGALGSPSDCEEWLAAARRLRHPTPSSPITRTRPARGRGECPCWRARPGRRSHDRGVRRAAGLLWMAVGWRAWGWMRAGWGVAAMFARRRARCFAVGRDCGRDGRAEIETGRVDVRVELLEPTLAVRPPASRWTPFHVTTRPGRRRQHGLRCSCPLSVAMQSLRAGSQVPSPKLGGVPRPGLWFVGRCSAHPCWTPFRVRAAGGFRAADSRPRVRASWSVRSPGTGRMSFAAFVGVA